MSLKGTWRVLPGRELSVIAERGRIVLTDAFQRQGDSRSMTRESKGRLVAILRDVGNL